MASPLMRLAFMALLLLPAIPPAAAQPGPDQPNATQRLEFRIMRNGDQIGTHSMTVQPQQDGTIVDITSDIVVKVMSITVYRFAHRSRETWRGEQLAALTADTNDDGDKVTLAVETAGDTLKVVSNGKVSNVPAAMLPASLWNIRSMRETRLLSTLDGRAMPVTLRERGEEAIVSRGQSLLARRFSITGELEREVWYDRAGNLLQIQLQGKDGSTVQFERR